jgi:hypothetical protein
MLFWLLRLRPHAFLIRRNPVLGNRFLGLCEGYVAAQLEIAAISICRSRIRRR